MDPRLNGPDNVLDVEVSSLPEHDPSCKQVGPGWEEEPQNFSRKMLSVKPDLTLGLVKLQA